VQGYYFLHGTVKKGLVIKARVNPGRAGFGDEGQAGLGYLLI